MKDVDPGPGLDDAPEPPRLRQLRWLVNALMVAMIAGVLVIAAALVIRLNAPGPRPVLPEAVALPSGETARAVTFGEGWIAVVTVDAGGRERIRVMDAETGAPRASLEIPSAARSGP
jgi:hypothetical protein